MDWKNVNEGRQEGEKDGRKKRKGKKIIKGRRKKRIMTYRLESWICLTFGRQQDNNRVFSRGFVSI